MLHHFYNSDVGDNTIHVNRYCVDGYGQRPHKHCRWSLPPVSSTSKAVTGLWCTNILKTPFRKAWRNSPVFDLNPLKVEKEKVCSIDRSLCSRLLLKTNLWSLNTSPEFVKVQLCHIVYLLLLSHTEKEWSHLCYSMVAYTPNFTGPTQYNPTIQTLQTLDLSKRTISVVNLCASALLFYFSSLFVTIRSTTPKEYG